MNSRKICSKGGGNPGYRVRSREKQSMRRGGGSSTGDQKTKGIK